MNAENLLTVAWKYSGAETANDAERKNSFGFFG
jgi:hypothetical protein